MDQVFENYALPVLSIANSLGSDAIQSIVLPNLALFLSRTEKGELPFIYSILVRRLSPSSPNYYFRYLFRNHTTFSVKRAYSTRPSTTRFATTSATRWPFSTKPRNVWRFRRKGTRISPILSAICCGRGGGFRRGREGPVWQSTRFLNCRLKSPRFGRRWTSTSGIVVIVKMVSPLGKLLYYCQYLNENVKLMNSVRIIRCCGTICNLLNCFLS